MSASTPINSNLAKTPLLKYPERPFCKRVKETANRVTESVQNIWKHIGKGIGILKKGLKVLLYSTSDLVRFERRQKKIAPLLAGLGVPSVISIPFNLKDIGNEVSDLAQNHYRLRDTEGAALSALGITLSTADSIDSYLTFESAMHHITNYPLWQGLSVVAFPAIYVMMAGGTILSGYHIFNTQKFRRQESNFLSNAEGVTQDSMEQFLTRHLGKAEDTNKEKKEAHLKRKLTSHMLTQLKTFQNDTATPAQREKLIENINKTCFRKTVLKVIVIAATALAFVGLLTFSMSVAPYVPFVLLGASSIIRFGTFLYEKHWMNKDLTLEPNKVEVSNLEFDKHDPSTSANSQS